MHSAVLNSPRAYARVRAIRARGRSSSAASASNKYRTRSAQSAAQAATRRRSASLSVCGDPVTDTARDLGDLIADSGWYPQVAWCINDADQIAGFASHHLEEADDWLASTYRLTAMS
jgi:hypothetical protein